MPAPPTGFMAVSGESGIDLSWDAPSDDIVGYSIYRCEEGEAPCAPEWVAWVANEGDACADRLHGHRRGRGDDLPLCRDIQ